MPPFSDLRSDYPLNFICFGPPYRSVFDGLYEATSLVRGFVTDVCWRDTEMYRPLCYSRLRSTNQRPSELWLTRRYFLQRCPGIRVVRERSQAELFRALAQHLDVDRYIPEFYLNDVPVFDDTSIVHPCLARTSMSMMTTPAATSAIAAHRIAPYPNPNSKRKEPVMPNSRGHLRFEPLFTTEEIGLRQEASIEHVMKVFLNVGEGIASRWIEMPKCVLLLQSVPDSPASGAIYLYDRERHVFYLIVFEQGRDDTLTTAEFEELVAEYDLLGCAENPRLLMPPLSSLGNA